jgi:hypothetical protein
LLRKLVAAYPAELCIEIIASPTLRSSSLFTEESLSNRGKLRTKDPWFALDEMKEAGLALHDGHDYVGASEYTSELDPDVSSIKIAKAETGQVNV